MVTGGAGFIGGTLIRKLLVETDATVFNLDKLGYASDLTSINLILNQLGSEGSDRYKLLSVDLFDKQQTHEAIAASNPDLVLHLAAESHVDRSIESPEAFVNSNVIGTFNLLQAVLKHWQALPKERQNKFRFHHISTDEVFGSLGEQGFFSEKSAYDPRSPYSASKAASDHLVHAWHHTYGLPIVLTNCSNNFGPWQFPEKLIPLVILKALRAEPIPLYGDGKNIRDWLYVDDHVEALLLVATKGQLGKSYCIGGRSEKSNLDVVKEICVLMDKLRPKEMSHKELITKVADRPGHDRRYAIDSTWISQDLGWTPKNNFQTGLEKTVFWYLQNTKWCNEIREKSAYMGNRIGLNQS